MTRPHTNSAARSERIGPNADNKPAASPGEAVGRISPTWKMIVVAVVCPFVAAVSSWVGRL